MGKCERLKMKPNEDYGAGSGPESEMAEASVIGVCVKKAQLAQSQVCHLLHSSSLMPLQ